MNREDPLEKLIRKMKQEPIVPVGTILTAGILIGGLRKFQSGAPKAVQQRYMRYRVAAQGVTILAIACGGIYKNWDYYKDKYFS